MSKVSRGRYRRAPSHPADPLDVIELVTEYIRAFARLVRAFAILVVAVTGLAAALVLAVPWQRLFP